jgi:hypothetical protein
VTMPLDSKSSQQRRYGFSCTPCRSKKIKCDGERPQCGKCVRSNLECIYKVTDASSNHLRSELARSRARIHELEEGVKFISLASGEERDRRIRQLASSCATSSTIHPRSEPQIFESGGIIDLRGQNDDGVDDNDQEEHDGFDQNKVMQAEVTIEEDGSVAL